jgi:hypothetical protein
MYENQVVTWMLKLKAAARTHKNLFREAGRRSSYFDQDLETEGNLFREAGRTWCTPPFLLAVEARGCQSAARPPLPHLDADVVCRGDISLLLVPAAMVVAPKAGFECQRQRFTHEASLW